VLKRGWFQLFIVMLLFIITIPASSQAKLAEDPMIRVGIWSNQFSILIGADDEYAMVDSDTGNMLGRFSGKDKATISVKEKGLAINGVLSNARHLKVVKLSNNEHGDEQYVEVNKRRYRGEITIHQTYEKAGLTVVNTLSIEQYLYGVIAREISPEWSLEAVKAQAVAARTYALFNLNKHKIDEYDVCATTDCQVYGGRESEAPGSIRAVDDTRGQVILYQGKLITAAFHSSSGGYTENSENVWGSYLPYLRGVPDYDQNGLHYKWEKTITPLELQELIHKAGYDIGTLQAIEVSALTALPMKGAADRGVSGRVKSLGFIGSKGNIQLPGSKLRTILSLNSTLFDIKMIIPRPKTLEFQITDSYGDRENKQVDLNLAPAQEKDFLLDKKNIYHVSGRTGETILISGFGSGHGVGLSQWGAKAMAEKGPQGDPTYYKEILKHYYQGVAIQRYY
jgi:stage II sporulation protein D